MLKSLAIRVGFGDRTVEDKFHRFGSLKALESDAIIEHGLAEKGIDVILFLVIEVVHSLRLLLLLFLLDPLLFAIIVRSQVFQQIVRSRKRLAAVVAAEGFLVGMSRSEMLPQVPTLDEGMLADPAHVSPGVGLVQLGVGVEGGPVAERFVTVLASIRLLSAVDS